LTITQGAAILGFTGSVVSIMSVAWSAWDWPNFLMSFLMSFVCLCASVAMFVWASRLKAVMTARDGFYPDEERGEFSGNILVALAVLFPPAAARRICGHTPLEARWRLLVRPRRDGLVGHLFWTEPRIVSSLKPVFDDVFEGFPRDHRYRELYNENHDGGLPMVGLGMPDEDRVTVSLRRADRFCGLDIMREIASYLSGVYGELSEGRGYSDLLRLDISTAPASGRAKRLVIGQRDGEGLNANGLVIQYWVADNEGFREDPQAVPRGSWGEDHLIENPMVLFISDGQGVWLAAKFGPNWNRFKLGRLNDVGAVQPENLVDQVMK
jgi:hypothetical protein